ncbi:MAG: hypothetical protein GTN99_08065 [Candidatus Dadabacteria bacterium]|nr:hypothetical protein [Candidatus Dadabacteria bacterium]
MPTPADDIKDKFRLAVDDPELPGNGDDSDSLWTDEEIFSYMDDIQHRFAEITEIFLDSTTPEITQLALTADTAEVTLDERIIDITRAKLASNGRKLKIAKTEDLDLAYFENDYGQSLINNWETLVGTPKCLVLNTNEDSARIAPIPDANDTINLTVVRYPLEEISNGFQLVEGFKSRYMQTFIAGLKSLAYQKEDADVFDLDLARQYELDFNLKAEQFSRKIRNRRRPAGTVHYKDV